MSKYVVAVEHYTDIKVGGANRYVEVVMLDGQEA